VPASGPDVRALGGPRDRRAPGETRDVEPLPVEGVLTSRFGHRRDPFHGRTRAHKGIDIAADMGAPIQAVRPGRVQVAEERDGFGRVVVIEHEDGLSTLYAHCNELKVAQGQQVSRGDEIATVGDTGRTTGPHLHFEARLEGVSQDPLRLFGWKEVLGQ
ncbi:MAG: M23 family metallopeptidase, partial [Myxococcota bacterium]|nr:M23 family metallopeptidase [Myxococcota bacterium]